MKNILWIVLLLLSTFSCLKNIDDVELNNHPFDNGYELPMGIIENITFKDTLNGAGLPKCIVQFYVTPNEETLNRVKATENIFAKNVRFVIQAPWLIYERALFSLDLEDVKANQRYFVTSWSSPFDCGDNLCLELLYADQDDGQPWENPISVKKSKIQKESCFTITL